MKGLPTNLFSQLQVRCLGRDNRLSELFDEEAINDLRERLQNSLDLKEYITLILDSHSQVVPLLRNTIPNQEEYYVPRNLIRRISVNGRIFRENCQDVFVFSNLTRVKLTQLATLAKCHTSTSTQQLFKISSRFILLEKESHWQDICEVANGVPVHLITYELESDTYLLTKTTGGSRIINQFLDYPPEGDHFLVNEDDVTTLEIENGLAVCDLPGMGKSFLLANLARKFSEYNTETITAFISLPTAAKYLKSATDIHLSNFELAVKVLAQCLAPTEIAKQILCLLLEKRSTPVHLYFDGLDEVSSEHLSVAKTFLKTLKNEEKWCRLHVTSRTHMRHELEAALGVIPYDIVPFTHENKILFLTKFWKHQHSSCNKSKLAEFADYCLTKFQEHIKDEGVEITGIPLQCRLLAEVYSRHAHRYAKESIQLTDIQFTETSLLQIYNSYLRLGLYRVEKHILSSSLTQSISVAEKLIAVERFHIWHALKLLYPQIADTFAKRYRVDADVKVAELETIMCMGFLVPHTGTGKFVEKFVHRTFAEFLVARFFASILGREKPADYADKKIKHFEKQVIEYFFQQVANHEKSSSVFYCKRVLKSVKMVFGSGRDTTRIDVCQFSSYVVMRLLNDGLDNYSCFNGLCSSAFSRLISAKACYGMMVSAIFQNFPTILRVVKFALAGLSKFRIWLYRRYLSGIYKQNSTLTRQLCLLYFSAKFANITVAHELYQILSEIFLVDLFSLHNEHPKSGLTPLHVAVDRAEYEMVEHVLQFTTCCNEVELMEYMFSGSYGNPSNIVQSKVAVCQLLSCRNPHAISELEAFKFMPVNDCGIHSGIIKILAQERMKVRKDYWLDFIDSAAESWKAEELFELFLFLTTYVSNQRVLEYHGFPLFNILKRCRESVSLETIKLISRNVNVKWDQIDENGNTLLHTAIAGNQSIDVIKAIIENGVNVNARNQFGWTSLHVAAALRNVNLMYHLLDIGVSITKKSNSFETPLHLFLLNTKAAINRLEMNKLLDDYLFKFVRSPVPGTLLHDLTTKIITSQQNDQVLQSLSEKDENGRTILHNFLTDGSGDLEMSSETLSMMMDSLRISASQTDYAGKNLLDAAIKGGKNKSILKLLRQKLADGLNVCE